MKYVIFLPDGAADVPLDELDGRTPLDFARIPNIDRLSREGKLGCMKTIPPGFTSGTDVGTLSLLGYDPHSCYSGRAPLEAAAQGIEAGPDQIIFRCNFVTIEDGRMRDFTADHIPGEEAVQLIEALNKELSDEGCIFHSGVSYRNLMLLSDALDLDLKCAPPHDISDRKVENHYPEGRGAERVMRIMNRASAVLADHPINRKKREAKRPAAENIWLWGQGRPMSLESFESRFGVRAAVITGVDIIRGIAKSLGMDLIHVPGATGYIDTDYHAKGRAAVKALSEYDVVLVHVEAPDEAGHLGNASEKIKALEEIDRVIVAPLMDELKNYEKWRVFVAPDHPTPVTTKAHSTDPVPFCMSGHGFSKSGRNFCEREAEATGILADPAYGLIEDLLRKLD